MNKLSVDENYMERIYDVKLWSQLDNKLAE